jgi:hypothetical protein
MKLQDMSQPELDKALSQALDKLFELEETGLSNSMNSKEIEAYLELRAAAVYRVRQVDAEMKRRIGLRNG